MQIPTEEDKLRIPKSEVNPYEENKENEEPKSDNQNPYSSQTKDTVESQQ